MSYRFMRVIVLFDLPSVTNDEKREYRKFRKFLIRNGFIMQQESVYVKLALNPTASNAIMSSVRKNKPKRGVVQMLTITEKQYTRMEYVVGDSKSDILNTDDRLTVI